MIQELLSNKFHIAVFIPLDSTIASGSKRPRAGTSSARETRLAKKPPNLPVATTNDKYSTDWLKPNAPICYRVAVHAKQMIRYQTLTSNWNVVASDKYPYAKAAYLNSAPAQLRVIPEISELRDDSLWLSNNNHLRSRRRRHHNCTRQGHQHGNLFITMLFLI